MFSFYLFQDYSSFLVKDISIDSVTSKAIGQLKRVLEEYISSEKKYVEFLGHPEAGNAEIFKLKRKPNQNED